MNKIITTKIRLKRIYRASIIQSCYSLEMVKSKDDSKNSQFCDGTTPQKLVHIEVANSLLYCHSSP